MTNITICNNHNCERKNHCLRYVTWQKAQQISHNNFYSCATFACDGMREEYYLPIKDKKG